MKKFLLQLFSFIAILVTVILLGYLLACAKANSFQLDKKSTICFMGDSHFQKGIDNKLIPNSVNLALSAEQYLYTYYKLKLILKNENSVKKVYLGFGFHNLSALSDEFVTGKKTKLVSTKYFFILPFQQQIDMIRATDDKPLMLKNIVKEMFRTLAKPIENQNFIGFYQNKFDKSSANKKSILKRIKQHYYIGTKVLNFSKTNLDYLLKIQTLCQKNNVELILVNTPLHPKYRAKIPSNYPKYYVDFCKVNQLKIMDLSAIKLPEDNYIFDGDHVSKKGSTHLTTQYFKPNSLQ